MSAELPPVGVPLRLMADYWVDPVWAPDGLVDLDTLGPLRTALREWAREREAVTYWHEHEDR